MPTETKKSLAVTGIGLIGLLCGVGYLALGGGLILTVAGWFGRPDPDPAKQIVGLLVIAAPLIVDFGILFLLLGMLLVLAALGVLRRKPWAPTLTFICAAPVIVLGLVCLSGVQDVVQDATDLALGVIQVLYGIAALVILSVKRAEFSVPSHGPND